MVKVWAEGLPLNIKELKVDFSGCESVKGSGLLDLFQRLSAMQSLTKLSLDFGEVYDLSDFVLEGLSMLLQSLSTQLESLYIDLYQVDGISQDGYLILAQSISNLTKLNYFHLDLSANPNLSQDALQLAFSNLPSSLRNFNFRILELQSIQHIGGGSFFKLANKIAQMKQLQQLCLTISTFSNINHKGVYMILKSIGGLQALKILSLNFSDINLPQKYLSYLKLPLSLKSLSLDLSCNPNLSDIDIISLTSKLSPSSEFWPKIYSLKLNFDFCKKISQQALEQLVQNLSQNKYLQKLMLVDRNYSKQFIRRCVKILESGACFKSIILFGTNSLKDLLAQGKSPRKESNKKRRSIQEAEQKQKNSLIQKQGDSIHKNQEKYYDYENYKIRERYRRNVLFSSYLIRKNGFLKPFQRDLIRLFLP